MTLKKKNPSGVILLLVILIVTAILSTSAIFGALILRDIQQSRLIDQSMQAFYLAESGLERALYQVRHLEAVQSRDCNDLVAIGGSSCDNGTGFCSGTSVSCITADKGNLDWSKGDWDIAVKNEREVAVNLRAGESVQIDLFNPYKTGESQTKVESFLVAGPAAASIYGELNNLTWLLGGTASCFLPAPAWPTISRNFIPLLELEEGNYLSGYLTAICDLKKSLCISINPNCSYILRLSNNIFSATAPGIFTVSIYGKAVGVTEADKLDIPSRLDISAKAVFGNSSQLVRAKTPMRPPLSGLYDFVVFSEQPIVK